MANRLVCSLNTVPRELVLTLRATFTLLARSSKFSKETRLKFDDHSRFVLIDYPTFWVTKQSTKRRSC